VLIDKIQSNQRALEQTPIPRDLIWVGLRQAIWRSIAYVLPAISLSKKEGILLAKELYRLFISKLDCNRNFPLKLRYNSAHLLGLGFFDPYLEQGISKLKVLLTHGASPSITGKLLQHNIEQHQLELGLLQPMFSLSYDTYSHLTTKSWLTELWEFINHARLSVSCSELLLPHPQRQRDRSIMDIWLHDHNFSQSIQQALNRVRCYLQVMTVADLLTGDGKHIRFNYLHALHAPSTSIWI